MRPVTEELLKERDALLDEYHRLTILADDALTGIPIRGRPNWVLFYDAQDEIVSVVRRIREITDGMK